MNKIELIKVETVEASLLQEIVRRIVKEIRPLKIILFGSWAYGKPQKGSDLDILIVVDDDKISRLKIAAEAYGALAGILIPKDIIVVTPRIIEEWKNVRQAFITTIVNKGKVIYEREDRPG